MKLTSDYQNALIASLALHVGLVILLLLDPTSHSTQFTTKTPTEVAMQPTSQAQAEPIKAVSVNAQDLQKTVDALKQKAIAKKQQEINHQRALEQQVAEAKRQRIAEQKKVQQLKQEAERIAIAKKKQIADEQKRLQEIAKQKQLEEKKLAEMKQKQAIEASKLTELVKKKADELAKMQKDAAEKQKMVAIKKQQESEAVQKMAAAKEAAITAERNAQVAGEVDRYKALIIGAISRQWILPESAQKGTSSEFRIRLAPDGSVLEVTLTRGSGDPLLDRSAQSAIYKASPLPVPTDQQAFNIFRDIILTVRPENARG